MPEVGYFARRRQEEEKEKNKSNSGDGTSSSSSKKNLYLLLLNTAVIGLFTAGIAYFGIYRPEHKIRLDAQRKLSKIEEKLQFTELQKDTITIKLAQSDSLKEFYTSKSEKFSKRSYALGEELNEIKVLADSTESRLKSQITIFSDSLRNARDDILGSELKISALETRLQESNIKVKALADSTYSLSNIVLTQYRSIADKDLKIESLTPPGFDIINNTSLDIYAQTSQEKQDQGYGFGVSTKLFGNSTAGLRARADAIFSLDRNKTNKDFGSGLYLKDRQANFVFEFVGGVNMQTLNVGGTDTNLYIRPCINLNMFGIRGLYLGLYSKGVNKRSPSIGLGTSFGKK